MASMFFDLNRSLAWGLGGQSESWGVPLEWETAIFNGFITGGAETGSVGALDNNFAYSGHIFAFPSGDWGAGTLADFDWHETLATRVGAGYARTTIDRNGPSEFSMIRVVDSGDRLSNLLPGSVDEYNVNTYCVDASCKYQGWSVTSEYYFRNISGFQGADLPDLFDHGFWLQVGKFVVPRKLELLSRWSRVVGTSGTLGMEDQSADEIAGGLVWYFRGSECQTHCRCDVAERCADQFLGARYFPRCHRLVDSHADPVCLLRPLRYPPQDVTQDGPARRFLLRTASQDPIVVQSDGIPEMRISTRSTDSQSQQTRYHGLRRGTPRERCTFEAAGRRA